MDLTRPYMVTYIMHDQIDNFFVQIDCENDIVGYGAGSPSIHVTGEAFDQDFEARKDELSDWLVGRDIRHFQQLIFEARQKYPKRPALLAALDMAFHDAFCQSIGLPVVSFLGQKINGLPTSITIGIKNLADTLEDGKEYLESGYKIIKLKIGHSVGEDIERFIKLRELVGNRMLIRVDANQGYNVDSFNQFWRATEPYGVEFFEQPFTPQNNDDMLELGEDLRNHCAADESLHASAEAVHLAAGVKRFGIFNIKLMKCGGIAESQLISKVAITNQIDLMWGCMDESKISIAAALHSALSCANTRYIDLDGSFDLAKDVVEGGFKLHEGVMYPLLERTGLGVKRL